MSLTTHVLDLVSGVPAAGIKVEVFIHADSNRRLLNTMETNEDGRAGGGTSSRTLQSGEYEMIFHVRNYLNSARNGAPADDFLNEISIRFCVSQTRDRYHIPLLLAPYGYSVYRGS